jgi:Sigma-70 factor, region 1.2
MSIDLMNRQFDRTDDRTSIEADSSYELEDSLGLYARGVGRVPMLSPAEERELFRRKLQKVCRARGATLALRVRNLSPETRPVGDPFRCLAGVAYRSPREQTLGRERKRRALSRCLRPAPPENRLVRGSAGAPVNRCLEGKKGGLSK